MDRTSVVPVAEARRDFSRILRAFRTDPRSAAPVVVGSHRKPEAVIAPIDFHWSAPTIAFRDEVHRLRDVIAHLAEAANLHDVALVGSVARGEDTVDSDIDLLVSLGAGADYFDSAQFAIDVEAVLRRSVDVIDRGTLAEGHPILAEAVPL